jgi:plasmid stability protein
MHAIQIRNVPDELYNKLKKVSKMHHRTMSGETLSILEKNLHESNSEESIFSQIAGIREEIRNTFGASESSLKNIREDRSR